MQITDVNIYTRAHRFRTEREFFIDNLLVRIHLIIAMIRWTGLAPWEFEFPFPGLSHARPECRVHAGETATSRHAKRS